MEKPEQRCQICSQLIIKTPELRHWYRSGAFNVNFEHISQIAVNKQINKLDFEQIHAILVPN